MARLPSWRDQVEQDYTGARKWGTGVNPIHARRGGYEGRNIRPHNYEPEDPGFEVGETYAYEDWSYTDDIPSNVDHSFLMEHPNLSDPSVRGQAEYPSWNENGWRKRATYQAVDPREGKTWQAQWGNAADGWRNKETGEVLNSTVADDTQLWRQTSFQQRDQTRHNEAAQFRGTDDARSGIVSRIPGMRVKSWSGETRHAEMEPKSQDYHTRPWRYRGVGTGPRDWMLVNEMYVSEPIQRQVPADVDQGGVEIDMTSGGFYDESWD